MLLVFLLLQGAAISLAGENIANMQDRQRLSLLQSV